MRGMKTIAHGPTQTKDVPHHAAGSTPAPVPLRWDDVKLLAEQEYCSVVHAPATTSKPGTFRKHDPATNAHVWIDVWCAEATADVSLDHPRQGKIRVFFRDVDRKLLREIFRNPRESAGYSDLRGRGTRQDASSSFAFGDVVQVNGYGLRGCAKVTGVRDHATGLVKIQFGDGQEYRVHPKQLTKAHLGPKPDPPRMSKCQTLRNEVKLQLRRIDRELAMLQQERQAVFALQTELERGQQVPEDNAAYFVPVDRDGSPSPRSFPRMNPQPQPPQVTPSADDGSPTSFSRMDLHHQETPFDLFPFADANLDSILSDSGAFARPLQPHLQPSLSWQTHSPLSSDGSNRARSILPPLDHAGSFGV